MASSKKKESEGIALLSMYNDEEDEEMEDADEDKESNEREEEDLVNFDTDSVQETTSSYFLQSQNSLPMEDEDSTPPKDDRVSTPTPQPQISLSSPPPPQLLPPSLPPPLPPTTFEVLRTKKRSLTIVDYGHDDTAMSPEAEEGEIMDTGHVTFGEDLQTSNGNFQGITPPGTVQILTPNIQETPPQPSERPELLQSDSGTTTISVSIETETIVVEETVMVSVEMQKDVDHLDNFLPPPPKTMCSEELQEKINKFLALKRAGKSFNAEVRNRKDYRNPDFLLHAVRYQDIDQIGSYFSKDVFDPHGYDKSDFYDAIEADMKLEMERKEQEKKKSQRLDFVGGGTQVGGVAPAQRNNIQNPVVPTVASTGFHSHPMPADSMARESRQNKKSKWDKADGDRKNPLHIGGQDALSTAAAHAAILSAANVGAGYTAFAQQKRKEAEGKRSSEKRRS